MLLASVALTEPPSTPPQTRLALLAMAGIGAFWFLVCRRILSRGSVNLRSDRRVITAFARGCAVRQTLFFAWRSEAGSVAAPSLIVSLVFVVVAAATFIAQRVQRSELRIREGVLRSRQDVAG